MNLRHPAFLLIFLLNSTSIEINFDRCETFFRSLGNRLCEIECQEIGFTNGQCKEFKKCECRRLVLNK
jgi:hypothetical protein